MTLKGRGAKVKKPAFKPAGKAKAPVQPKSFTIEPNKGDRPVSIKDFVLPKGTKMQISFKKVKPAAKGSKAKAPVKKKAVAKRKAPAKKAPAKGTRKAPARKASAKKPAGKIQVNVGAKKRPQRKKK